VFVGVAASTAVQCDVTAPAHVADLVALVNKRCVAAGGLHALVNNAGISQGFVVDLTPIEMYRRVMEACSRTSPLRACCREHAGAANHKRTCTCACTR
jgi:NAD(P)-dependent dehydrogenase (short-subunit alcohol dehydrogenase family)